MKPFDLEAAMRGEPLVTRDGRKAKFVAYEPEADVDQGLVVLIEGEIVTLHKTGTYLDPSDSNLDLFMDEPTLILAGIEFPEPLRKAPAKDQEIWLVDVQGPRPIKLNWEATDLKQFWLKSGLIQATQEGAELQRRAMIESELQRRAMIESELQRRAMIESVGGTYD